MVSRRCKITFLVFGLLVNALDFISDWLFYVSTKEVEKGLVYGPIDPIQVTALLVFSIIGSVGFVVEIVVFFFELKKDDDHHGDVFLDLFSGIIIWIEDIPQVIISFSIALCREEAISIFQLTKAGIVLVGTVITVTATLIRFCKKCDSTPRVCAVRLILMLGILIEGGFAVGIFYLTQTELDTHGDVAFKVPTTVFDDHLSDHQYLTNVHVFISHLDIFDAWNLDTNKHDLVVNWLRLFSLNGLKEKSWLSFKLNYQHVGIQVVNMAIWFIAGIQAHSNATWTLSQCYSINQNTAEVTVLPDTTCVHEILDGNSSTSLFLDFRYEQPDKGMFYQKRIFGEIFFNMRVCNDGSSNDTHSFIPPVMLHYFHVSNLETDGNVTHLYTDRTEVVRFYRNQSPDMTDVVDVWKTGWNKCSSTGSLSPVLDRNIKIECKKA